MFEITIPLIDFIDIVKLSNNINFVICFFMGWELVKDCSKDLADRW